MSEAVETGEADCVAGDGACGAVRAVSDGRSLVRCTITSCYASRALLSCVHLVLPSDMDVFPAILGFNVHDLFAAGVAD